MRCTIIKAILNLVVEWFHVFLIGHLAWTFRRLGHQMLINLSFSPYDCKSVQAPGFIIELFCIPSHT